MHIFVDESGDLGTTEENAYFVVGMVFCNESNLSDMNKTINKHNRYLWANGWPRNLEIKATNLYNYKNRSQEIKADVSKISPRLYLQKIYRDINKMDVKAGFLIHKPANQGPALRCLTKERVYNFLSKKLYQACFHYLKSPLFIRVDQRNITLVKKQKEINRSIQRLNLNYIGYIEHELTYQFATRYHVSPKIEIEFTNSKRIKGLQVADYLSWAIRRKYEGRSFWVDLTDNIKKIEKKDNF